MVQYMFLMVGKKSRCAEDGRAAPLFRRSCWSCRLPSCRSFHSCLPGLKQSSNSMEEFDSGLYPIFSNGICTSFSGQLVLGYMLSVHIFTQSHAFFFRESVGRLLFLGVWELFQKHILSPAHMYEMSHANSKQCFSINCHFSGFKKWMIPTKSSMWGLFFHSENFYLDKCFSLFLWWSSNLRRREEPFLDNEFMSLKISFGAMI